MNSLGNVCKGLGYAVVASSLIYSGSAVLANSEVQEVALRILTSSPFTGAGYGLLSCGFVGALIGYSQGSDCIHKYSIGRLGSALIGGAIGIVGGALGGAVLLTSYNHISIQIV